MTERETKPSGKITTLATGTGNGIGDTAAANLPAVTRGLYIGTAGALKFTTEGGEDITFDNAIAGYHPLKVVRVWATGSATAVKDDIHALF